MTTGSILKLVPRHRIPVFERSGSADFVNLQVATMSVDPEILADNDPYKGEREGKLREVGGQAVWSLSSCKPGKTCIIAHKIDSVISF